MQRDAAVELDRGQSVDDYVDRRARVAQSARAPGRRAPADGLRAERRGARRSFKPTLVGVVHAWATGASFKEIINLSDLFEGTVVRAVRPSAMRAARRESLPWVSNLVYETWQVRRLDELLGQLAAAAQAVGDAQLEKSFEAAALLLRRGVMFSNSLYT